MVARSVAWRSRAPASGPPRRASFRGWLAALLLAIACTGTPAAAATLAVLMIPPVAFTQRLHDAIAEEAATRGLTVDFAYAPEGAGDRQIAQVRQFIAEKVDALLVMPVDPQANATITRLAQDADIPLVYINDGPREDWFAGRVGLVLPNDLVAGRLQMRKLAQMMNNIGRIAIVSGHPSHPGSALRTQGVKEVIAELPGLRVVAEAPADWDRGKAAALVAGWLAAGIAIDAIAANNDAMAIGAAEAVASAGKGSGRILIGGVDATPEGMTAMQESRMAVTVFQDAGRQGRRAVEDALKLIHREPVQQYDWVPFALITDRMTTTHMMK